MTKITPPKDNAVLATYLFIKTIGAKVTQKTVEETLKDHPYYPSLLTASDALNQWNIENISLKLKPEQLTEIPTPFLTYLTGNGGAFAVVKSMKENVVEWGYSEKEIRRDTFNDFTKKWSGITLVAETNENSGEKKYKQNREKEVISNLSLPFFLISTVFIISSIFYYSFLSDWHYNALLVTKFAGFVISSILLWQSVDKSNPFIQNLCQVGSKTDCKSIINSKAAQITSWLSWSEVGFFYFLGGYIALLTKPSSIILLQILGSFAIVYTVWSIFYQKFIAKQWCALCLTIQGLLWIEFFILLPIYSPFSTITINQAFFNHLFILLQCFIVPILIWIPLKFILQKSQQTNILKDDLRKFKNNPDLFLNLLQIQPEMPFVPKNLSPVIIGRPGAQHTITMITNPLCQPCAKAHQIINELIETNENVNCQVIFAASNHKNDIRGIVAKNILSLPETEQAEALHAWYENEERNIDKWARELNNIEQEKIDNMLEQHQIWVDLANITGTPTLYFNGFKMPDLYQIKDLNGLLKTLPITDFARS